MKRLLASALALALFAAPLAAQDLINPQTDQSQLTRNKGQLPGTATNDSASAGNVGEIIASVGMLASGTVTFSNGTATITDAATCTTGQLTGCIGIGQVVNFLTSGGLPTNFAVGTNYFVIATGFVSGTSYQVSTTPFGAAVTAGSAGSGTQTRVNTATGCGSNANCTVAAVNLTAGDWRCNGLTDNVFTGTTTVSQNFIGTTHNSATGRVTESRTADVGSYSAPEFFRPTAVIKLLPSTTTTYFLEASGTFSTGAAVLSGSLFCWRAR